MLTDPEYGRQDVQRIVQFRTVMAAPMLLDDEVVGAISLVRTEVDPFDDRALALVGAFAAQAAVVVRNVHLVRELEERGAELGRKVEQLEALSEVGGLVSSSLVLDEVLSNIIMNAVRFSGCDGGSIMEYVEAERCFSVRSAYASSPELLARLRTIRVELETTLVGRSALEGHPIAVADLGVGRARSAPAAALRRRLAVDDRGAGAARRADHRGARGAPEDDRGVLRRDGRVPRDLRGPVGARGVERAAVPRARDQERRAAGRQPAQVRVPREHVARAAHAAERRDRLLGGAAGAHVRRAERPPGRVPARHPEFGQAPAAAAERHPRPVEGRGRPHGARAVDLLAAGRARVRRSRWCASGPPRHGIDVSARGRRRARHDRLGRAPVQAGAAEPAEQRGEVHARRRARRASRPDADGERDRGRR